MRCCWPVFLRHRWASRPAHAGKAARPYSGRAVASHPWLVLAVVATTALAAVVAVSLRLLRVSGHGQAVGITGVVFASLVWLPVTRRWNARGHLCWSSTIFLFVVYLAFVLQWTSTVTSAPPVRPAACCCGCSSCSPRSWPAPTCGRSATRSDQSTGAGG